MSVRTSLAGLCLGAACSLGTGCTVWTDYGEKTEDAREAFQVGDFDRAYQIYKEDLDATNDGFLYTLEAGTAAHFAKRYDESLKLFDTIYRRLDAHQEQALAESAAQVVGSILVNEKTITYFGSIFEQVLTQAYQARNDFLRGRRDEVLVDIRRCYEIQKRAREIYDKELKFCEQEARVKNGDNVLDQSKVENELSQAYSYSGKELAAPEDVYDLAWVRYLNAWLREATARNPGDYNQAWIDLKFVADRMGKHPFVVQDLARMAEAAGAVDEAQELRQRAKLEPIPPEYGSVVLFFECGMAPRKREVKVIFPTYKGAAAVAVPVYESVPNPVQAAELVLGERRMRTVPFTNLDAVAFRFHKDQLPLMIAKMVIRLIVKIGLQSGGTVAIEQSTRGTKNEGIGQLAALGFSALTSVYNVISEQADLRCWRTLPQTFQAVRLYLPAGEYPCRIRLIGGGGEFDLGTIKVAAGKHRMINARSIGTRLFWEVPAEPYDGAKGKRAVEEQLTRDILGEGAPEPGEPVRPKGKKKAPSPQ